MVNVVSNCEMSDSVLSLFVSLDMMKCQCCLQLKARCGEICRGSGGTEWWGETGATWWDDETWWRQVVRGVVRGGVPGLPETRIRSVWRDSR